MSPTRFASEHRWIYLTAIALLVGLLIAGLVRFNSVRVTSDAEEKANRLARALDDAGFPHPDTETISRALGTDGGPVCDDPASALKSALWRINLSNGAGGPGQRPVIADSQAVEAMAMVLEVYCPERLPAIRDEIDKLKTDDTVRQ